MGARKSSFSTKSWVTVLPLASSFGTRKHASFTSWNPDPPGRDTDNLHTDNTGTLYKMVLIFQIKLWCHTKLVVDLTPLHLGIEEKKI